MGETKAQKRARKGVKAAVSTQQGAKEDFLGSPFFAALSSLTQGIVDNPQTFGPEQRQQLFDQNAALANESANSFVDQLLARQGAANQVRSGPTLGAEFQIGAQLGEALAGANRQVALQGAQQDRADTIQAIQSAQNILQLVNALDQQVASTQLGGASILTSLSSQPTIGQRIGSGVGQLAGNILGAGGQSSGGIPGVFGKG